VGHVVCLAAQCGLYFGGDYYQTSPVELLERLLRPGDNGAGEIPYQCYVRGLSGHFPNLRIVMSVPADGEGSVFFHG